MKVNEDLASIFYSAYFRNVINVIRLSRASLAQKVDSAFRQRFTYPVISHYDSDKCVKITSKNYLHSKVRGTP